MKREIYASDGKYMLFQISDEDRDSYVELHRQLNGESTLFLNPHCNDMMWEQVVEVNEDIVYSIYDNDGEYCGSIELQNYDSATPEIGIDLLENKRNKGIASEVVRLFAKRVYEERRVEYFLIRISSKNPHSRHVFEKMGVVFIGTTESPFDVIMRNCKNVLEEMNGNASSQDELEKDICKGSEKETIYEYKLIPELFL